MECDNDDSDYEATGITFDDAKDEMALGMNDGFDIIVKECEGNCKNRR